MPETPIIDQSEKLSLWFREDLHRITGAGIVRRSDEALLDEEGLPQSNALRAREEREQVAAGYAQRVETDTEQQKFVATAARAAAKQAKRETPDA